MYVISSHFNVVCGFYLDLIRFVMRKQAMRLIQYCSFFGLHVYVSRRGCCSVLWKTLQEDNRIAPTAYKYVTLTLCFHCPAQ
jgi:hypothetical protein